MPVLLPSNTSTAGADVSACTRCRRLVNHLRRQREQFPSYHNAPVNACGDSNARLLIVGLAPGLHGANASGIPFTGDASGQVLFRQLQNYGFAAGRSGDEAPMQLVDCRITNAVKCLPPKNLPSAKEVAACSRYLTKEIELVPEGGVILALGLIAHKAVLKALGLRPVDYPFGHQLEYPLAGNRLLLDSYHCSRYNMNTGRLSEAQFAEIFVRIQQLLK